MTASFDQMARGIPLNEIGYVELVVGNKTHYEYKPLWEEKIYFNQKKEPQKKFRTEKSQQL